MNIDVWTLTHDNAAGQKIARVFTTYDAAQEALAAYCRRNWPAGSTIPDDRQQLIQTYFIRAVEDSAEILPATLDVPSDKPDQIELLLIASSAHVTAEERDELSQWGYDVNHNDMTGWLFYVGGSDSDIVDNPGEGFVTLLRHARQTGCKYVLLEPDARKIAGVAVYD